MCGPGLYQDPSAEVRGHVQQLPDVHLIYSPQRQKASLGRSGPQQKRPNAWSPGMRRFHTRPGSGDQRGQSRQEGQKMGGWVDG